MDQQQYNNNLFSETDEHVVPQNINIQECLSCGNWHHGSFLCNEVFRQPSYDTPSTSNAAFCPDVSYSVQGESFSYGNVMDYAGPESYQNETTYMKEEQFDGQYQQATFPVENNQFDAYGQHRETYNDNLHQQYLEEAMQPSVSYQVDQPGLNAWSNLQPPMYYSEDYLVPNLSNQFPTAPQPARYQANVATTAAISSPNANGVPLTPPVQVTAQQNKRPRYVYSESQLEVLKGEFIINKYPSAERRRELATQISVTPTHINTWFKNRRQNEKRTKSLEE